MRHVPPALDAMLKSGVTTLCHGWRVTRTDGWIQGFTDHDRDLVVEGVLFKASAGISGTERAQGQGLSVTGGEFSGALSHDSLSEDDLSAGRYDGARVDLLLIDWTQPQNAMLLRRARIGEVRREQGTFVAELRGLADAFNETRGRTLSRQCDADLGDARCRVDLTHPDRRFEGTVSAVEGPLLLRIDALGGGERFTDGRLRFASGANAGLALEVRSHLDARIQLWQRPPLPVSAGDAVSLTIGCDKSFPTCRDRLGNAENLRGFPHVPGNDSVIAAGVPGEPGQDGRSRS